MKKSQAFTMFKSLVNLKSPRNFTQTLQINLGKLIYTDGFKLMYATLPVGPMPTDGTYSAETFLKAQAFVPSNIQYPNWSRILPTGEKLATYEIEITKGLASLKSKELIPVSVKDNEIILGNTGDHCFDGSIFSMIGQGLVAMEIYKDHIIFRSRDETDLPLMASTWFLMTVKVTSEESNGYIKKVA